MKDKVFLDTNVFIYSIDTSPAQKHKGDIARQLVKQHVRDGSGVISIQVLQEFYRVSTEKIEAPLSTEAALEYMHYVAVLETVHPDFSMLVAAIRLHKKLKISFWDALILQAASSSDCTLLLTEDMQAGLLVDNPVVKNPFLS